MGDINHLWLRGPHHATCPNYCFFSSIHGESFGNNAIDPIRRLIDPILIPFFNRGVFDNLIAAQEIQVKKMGGRRHYSWWVFGGGNQPDISLIKIGELPSRGINGWFCWKIHHDFRWFSHSNLKKPPFSLGISQLCLVTPDGQMMNCHFFAIRAGSLVPENGSSFRQ